MMQAEERKGFKDEMKFMDQNNVDSMPQFQRQAQFDNDSSHFGSVHDNQGEIKGVEDIVHQSGVMIVGMN